jgi:putative membrane-bound dehydrogenase-like protein
MRSTRLLWQCLAIAGAVAAFGADATKPIGLKEPLPRVAPLSPAEAVKSFQVLDGFRMELLAAEPLVTDPVAMAYDEDGRAYVCEMNDYPYTDKARHKPGQENPTDAPIGKVRLLVDDDGDGRFDRSTVFADGLSWPTGVACWKGGVFVAATPDVWYFKDTDGDGKADVKVKLFTGFRKLNVQAVMNNLIWGLDNKIYGAGSSNGGQVRRADQPEFKPVVIARNDYRFDPNTYALEAISGGARFGNSFDDWGNRFLCNIRNPAQHVVIENRYLARNPLLPVRSPVHDVAEAGDQLPVFRTSLPEAWRELRARIWAGDPSQATMPRSELVGAGVVTSSSGVTVYRGSAYPEKYRGNIFVADVAGNLFYRLKVEPDGVTFKATRADEKVDFVTSTDLWFRPVNFVNAPDGTLHVLDMYREVIEHPWSIPDDIHAALDLESGRDRGRICRLAPPDFKVPQSPHLSRASTAELVATLENPNSWWRETAHRLLFERQDKTAVELLRIMFFHSKNPLARLHALWSLEGLGALCDSDVIIALNDKVAGMREHGIKLSERLTSYSAEVDGELAPLARDPDLRVRFQFTLRIGDGGPNLGALATIAKQDAANEWMRTAIGSSSAETSHRLISSLLFDKEFSRSATNRDFLRVLAQVVGARNKPIELSNVLLSLRLFKNDNDVQRNILLGIGTGLKYSNHTLRKAVLEASTNHVDLVDTALTTARRTAADEKGPLPDRQQAIQLAALDEFERSKPVLTALLDARQPQEVQRAVVAALSGINRPEVAGILLVPWRAYTPAIRGEVIQALLGFKNRLLPLFDAIEAGTVSLSQIPPSRRALLLKHADKEVSARAAKVFGQQAVSPRKEAVEKYKAVLVLKGDAEQGRKVYETACLICHRAGDKGNDVGPNLAAVRSWGREQLLVNILDPNREVAPSFVEYVVDTKDGQTLSGLIADETATSISLKRADGVQQTILRQSIEKISSSGLSLMPEGLENGMSLQQVADLLAFLQSPQ